MSNETVTRPAGLGISFIVAGLILDFFLREAWQIDYVLPGVGVFGRLLFPIGMLLLVCSAWNWIQKRQDSNFLTTLSLADPED
jgi:hypothetical protein